MAYMRNQRDMAFSRGGQRNQTSTSYWNAVGGVANSAPARESYEEDDYEYEEDNGEDYYEEGDGDYEYSYEEGYEDEWQEEEDGGLQWQGDQRSGMGAYRGRGATAWSGDRGWGRSDARGRGFTRGSNYGDERMRRDRGSEGAFKSNRGSGRYEGGNRGSSGFDRNERKRRRSGSENDKDGDKRGSAAPSESTSASKYDKNAKNSKPAVTEVFSPSLGLNVLLEKWQTFAKEFADCGNAISNMECSLKASKVSPIQLTFDCKFLTKCNNYNIFSGTLRVNKMVDNVAKETIFLARGQGLNKKSAKLDCYEKAYNLLMNTTVEAMMTQTDFSEKVLKQEIHRHFRENPKDFLQYVKGGSSNEDSDQETKINTNPNQRVSTRVGMSDPKRLRMAEYVSDMVENKNLSLAPTKKIDLLMHPDDTLIDKLYTLKQLLKDEGITRLHIVPKIDQLAHKVAIHIQNVYRFEDVPVLGFGTNIPVYCEIYFDNAFIARGPADFNSNVAMQLAYSNLATLLYSKPLEELADLSKVWHPYMALDVNLCSVVTKWQGKDNDSLLTSNLTNMKQMMQSMPDVTIPVQKMVLTEHESDQNIENVFKSLELSATRNLMLLECEIMRNLDLTFTCTLSLQGRVLASRKHPTKNGAKRLASETVMNEMKKTHDIIYVKTEMVGRIITKSELLLTAAKKKALGEPPGKIFKKIPDHKDDFAMLSPEERRRQEIDRRKFEERENLPENINARPLYPWIAAAMYDILDVFYRNITLEDLMLDVGDMPKSQRDIVSSCAAKMGLRMVTKTKTSFDGPILRRTVTAQDMSKILQLHGGESGRYKLISCKNPLSREELDRFRKQCMEQHRKLIEARLKDSPDLDPEFAGVTPEYSSPSNSLNIFSPYPDSTPTRSPKDSYWGTQVLQPPSSAALAYMARTPVVYPGLKRFTGPPQPIMGQGVRPPSTPYYMNKY